MQAAMARTQAAAEVDNAVIDVYAMESEMKGKLDVLPERQPYTFPRVPAYFRKINEKLYEPTVISFGPYHHGSSHLQAMEKHKWTYLRDFLSRSTTWITLGDCLTNMKDWEKEARNCYSERITLTSYEFVEMMLLDACFIIELVFKLHNNQPLNLGWGFEYLPFDLLLIENQIPFFIIQRLFDLVVDSSTPRLEILILGLYPTANIFNVQSESPEPPTEIHHLLHLYHHWFVASVNPSTGERRSRPLKKLFCLLFSCFSSKRSDDEMSRISTYVIPCATELHEAGVGFKTKRVHSHFLDITFQGGVMEIPFFKVEDTTKPLISNIIAFEQSIRRRPRNMTSFCVLMDCLINTEKDVALLQRCDVIENWLGSDEQVAGFFNQIGENASYGNDHYLSEVFKQVNHYRNSSGHKHRARFCHDYFNNPWAFFSLLAALVLLALTFLQTFFAIYAYFRPPKSLQ